ncbi:hypothetical protein ABH899_003122 [Paenibacillus sp. RC84]
MMFDEPEKFNEELLQFLEQAWIPAPVSPGAFRQE